MGDGNQNVLVGKMTAIIEDFSSVTNVLALCTQQCLIKEQLLLLAIVLSTQHSQLSIEEFYHTSINKYFVESQSKRCHDTLCSEQVELIVFAILQMAKGNE